jgi:hypothetical protein
MTEQHPLTLPPEQVQRLLARFHTGDTLEATWAIAAQWGADQELEACLRLVEIEVCDGAYELSRYIRAARRPKPPSLKEQALKSLERMQDQYPHLGNAKTIRRAPEALPE